MIRGDRDVQTITKTVEALEKGIPGAKKVIIPGAGHMVNVEKPEEFNNAVIDILSKY